tara:strand:+ start:34 stop:603 length:570 start_codon:yes stop_codon:yes gene_type:complete
MGYYGKSNAANPVLIAKQELSGEVANVIFDGVFNGETTHYKLVIVGLQLADADTTVHFRRRANGSTLADPNNMKFAAVNKTNLESGETTLVETNGSGDYWLSEVNHIGTNVTRQALHGIYDIFPTVEHITTDFYQSVQTNAGVWYDDAGDVWALERMGGMLTGAGYDGVALLPYTDNISAGKFYIYAMV